MSAPTFVILYVADPAASAAFYASILGRPPVESSPTFAMFAVREGLMLGLWGKAGVTPAAGAPGGGEIALVAESDAAVDAQHAAWSARGVRIAEAPVKLDFGYAFLGLDPDGHRLRVFAPAAR